MAKRNTKLELKVCSHRSLSEYVKWGPTSHPYLNIPSGSLQTPSGFSQLLYSPYKWTYTVLTFWLACAFRLYLRACPMSEATPAPCPPLPSSLPLPPCFRHQPCLVTHSNPVHAFTAMRGDSGFKGQLGKTGVNEFMIFFMRLNHCTKCFVTRFGFWITNTDKRPGGLLLMGSLVLI